MDGKATPAQGGQADRAVGDHALRAFLGYRMKRAFNVLRSDLARTLAPFELRMLTYTALVLIVENPGLRQSQLARAMDVERPNLVAIVEALTERGLVERRREATDRRAYALMATEAGLRLCKVAVAAVQAHEAALIDGLDRGKLDAAIEVLERIETRGRRG